MKKLLTGLLTFVSISSFGSVIIEKPTLNDLPFSCESDMDLVCSNFGAGKAISYRCKLKIRINWDRTFETIYRFGANVQYQSLPHPIEAIKLTDTTQSHLKGYEILTHKAARKLIEEIECQILE